MLERCCSGGLLILSSFMLSGLEGIDDIRRRANRALLNFFAGGFHEVFSALKKPAMQMIAEVFGTDSGESSTNQTAPRWRRAKGAAAPL